MSNAPGLAEIRYRVGRHSSVKASILRGLADHNLPALAGLGARDDVDPTIALADGFACMAEVLTFYTERIAHESFLRTAVERLSIVELSRLIGYRPDPGVAAEAWLAFTVEEARTLPHQPARPVQVHVGTQVQSVPGQNELPVTFETVAPIEARAEWNAIPPVRSQWPSELKGRTSLTLARTGHRLNPGDRLLMLGSARATQSSSTDWEVRALSGVEEDSATDTTVVTWDVALTKAIPVSGATVHVFRLRAPMFGHNAPSPWLLSTSGTSLGNLADLATGTWNNFALPTDRVDLDQAYPQVVKNGWVLAQQQGQSDHLARVSGVSLPSCSDFGLSAKITRVMLDNTLPSTFERRSSVVYAQSEQLPLTADALTSAVEGDQVVLDTEVPLVSGQPLAVQGPAAGAPLGAELLSEVVRIAATADAVVVASGRTTVRFVRALSRAYDRTSTTFNANVAPAIEGAGVGEILGSGDATAVGQAFVLKQQPLTWTAGAGGRDAQLEVRVDEVAWDHRSSLFGAGAEDRVYTVETRDDGTSLVRFGDGVEGARLPTGQANVRARYRTGLGADGNVRTGQLTTLLSRPLGIASVANPAPAMGGEDPEPLTQARRNAPVTVRTLDRVVSRLDVEDYARAYPGVLTASAAWIPTGSSRGLALTVMGPGGALIDASVPTYQNLLDALRSASDTSLAVTLLSHVPVFLTLALRVLPDPDRVAEAVLADVRRLLLDAFGLESRELGQRTSVDEVVTLAHRAPGVVAVDVERLRRSDAPADVDVQHRVPAHPGGLGPANALQPAEIITLRNEDLTLEVLT
ncbi:putative baseplate assembly protein [Micromonospora sp. AP08]|uniref:putative baseplate assembly protein n=1 Tax=Micromonospora sp. AP08 TaxID=2604467 RepID=UPI0011D90BC3|nr:putative baseplate assembly protein [Micromonospora sp. AP08]TYB39681.1 putative baseplate assembly protein [Micromonospora sp. AP08]